MVLSLPRDGSLYLTVSLILRLPCSRDGTLVKKILDQHADCPQRLGRELKSLLDAWKVSGDGSEGVLPEDLAPPLLSVNLVSRLLSLSRRLNREDAERLLRQAKEDRLKSVNRFPYTTVADVKTILRRVKDRGTLHPFQLEECSWP
jgi:hypothetical protein